MSDKNEARVLIVDDVHINRMILSSLLASNGVSSDLAEGGEECLRLVEQNDYDLILLDHRMPEIDGVDTLMRLKEHFLKTGHEIPVVCHTTEDAVKNINLYKAAGFVDVLIKPIQPKILSEILMTYLPGGAEIEEKKHEEEQRRLLLEMEKLPEWLTTVEGIDVKSGVEHCDTAQDYLEALEVYVTSIHEKAYEIDHFAKDANLKMYSLRTHSLKSMSRLIGADKLADIAAEMEYAGKRDDIDTVMKKTPALLKEYRKFEPLVVHFYEDIPKEPDGAESVPIDVLDDAYVSIDEFAQHYDEDSIRMVLDSLHEYHLPEMDQARIANIEHALKDHDWEAIRYELS